jgi:hypothetical protein
MDDLFPNVSWEDSLKAIYQKFGGDYVRVPASSGDTFIDMPLAEGGRFTAGLTWQQAKYVAFRDVKPDDLRVGRFPPDWPKTYPRPSTSAVASKSLVGRVMDVQRRVKWKHDYVRRAIATLLFLEVAAVWGWSSHNKFISLILFVSALLSFSEMAGTKVTDLVREIARRIKNGE